MRETIHIKRLLHYKLSWVSSNDIPQINHRVYKQMKHKPTIPRSPASYQTVTYLPVTITKLCNQKLYSTSFPILSLFQFPLLLLLDLKRLGLTNVLQDMQQRVPIHWD